MNERKLLDLHPVVGNLVDAVNAADRNLLADHPEIEGFVRRRVSGEFAPFDAAIDGNAVAVVRPRPGENGVRLRRAVTLRPTDLPAEDHYRVLAPSDVSLVRRSLPAP